MKSVVRGQLFIFADPCLTHSDLNKKPRDFCTFLVHNLRGWAVFTISVSYDLAGGLQPDTYQQGVDISKKGCMSTQKAGYRILVLEFGILCP